MTLLVFKIAITQTLLPTTRQKVSNRVSNQLDFDFRYATKAHLGMSKELNLSNTRQKVSYTIIEF